MQSSLIITLALIFSAVSYADNRDNKNFSHLALQPVITSGINIPWAIAQLKDKSLLITDRVGNLLLYKNQKLTTVSGVPKVLARGQGGLLDLTLDPNFDSNNLLYLSYSYRPQSKAQGTAIAKAKLVANKLTQLTVLFTAKPESTRYHHYGSRIAIKDSYLYFSIGDRGKRSSLPQDKYADAGKIMRINLDGSIPKDNPFTDSKGKKLLSILMGIATHKAWALTQ